MHLVLAEITKNPFGVAAGIVLLIVVSLALFRVATTNEEVDYKRNTELHVAIGVIVAMILFALGSSDLVTPL